MKTYKNYTNYYTVTHDGEDPDLEATITTSGSLLSDEERIVSIKVTERGAGKLGRIYVDWLEEYKLLAIAVSEWLAENTNPPPSGNIRPLFANTSVKKPKSTKEATE